MWKKILIAYLALAQALIPAAQAAGFSFAGPAAPATGTDYILSSSSTQVRKIYDYMPGPQQYMPRTTPTGVSPVWYNKMYQSIGDSRIVKNNQTAVILNIPAGQAADTVFASLGHSRQVWAYYNPLGAVGRIQVIRAEKLPKDHGAVSVAIEDFSPRAAGPALKNSGYYGVDPFAQFSNPADHIWHKIDQAAFLTAASIAAQKHHVPMFWVGFANPQQTQYQTSSGDLVSSSQTTTIMTWVTTKWYAGIPRDLPNQGAFQTAYKVTGCNPLTEPIPRGETQNRGCIVRSAHSYVEFNGGDMPEDQTLVDTQSVTQSGWSFIAQLLITVAAVYLGGALYAMQASSAAMGAAAGFGTTGTAIGSTLTAGQMAAIGAAAYTGVTMANNGGQLSNGVQGSWGGTISNGFANPSANGFGDPKAAISQHYLGAGANGGGTDGQARMFNLDKPTTWTPAHDPALLKASPPQASGVLQGW